MAFVSELPESGTLISTGTVITITWDTAVLPLITYIPSSGPQEVVSSASPSAVFGAGYTGAYGIDGPNWTIAFRRDAGWTTSPFILSILDTVTTTETQINYTLLAEGQYPTDMQPFNDPVIGAGAPFGDVSGPGSATDNSVALFDTTTGKLLKDGVALGTAGNVLTSGGAGAPPSFEAVPSGGSVQVVRLDGDGVSFEYIADVSVLPGDSDLVVDYYIKSTVAGLGGLSVGFNGISSGYENLYWSVLGDSTGDVTVQGASGVGKPDLQFNQTSSDNFVSGRFIVPNFKGAGEKQLFSVGAMGTLSNGTIGRMKDFHCSGINPSISAPLSQLRFVSNPWTTDSYLIIHAVPQGTYGGTGGGGGGDNGLAGYGSWLYENTTSGAGIPNGRVRFNNTTITSASEFYLSKNNFQNVDIQITLDELEGWRLSFIKGDGTTFVELLCGPPVDSGTYFTIPIIGGSIGAASITIGDELVVSPLPSSTFPSGNVVGLGPVGVDSVALFASTSGLLITGGVALGTSGQVLTSGGPGAPPAFSTVAGTGDVVGPASAIDNSVPLFDTTTGKLLKDGVALGTSGQVLTSGGPGVPPSFEDGGGGGGFADAPDAALFTERADHVNTPAAGFGEFWLKNTAVQSPMFTSEADVDHFLVRCLIAEPVNNEVVTFDGTGGRTQSTTGTTLGQNSELIMGGSDANISMTEKTTEAGDGAGTGVFWVKDDIPSKPFFTDDDGTDFDLTIGGGSGDVVGPGPSVTDDAVVRFDGTGGLTIQESPVIIGDTGNVTGVLDITAQTITAQSGAETTEYAEYGIGPYSSRITQFTIGGVAQTGTVIDVSLLGMGSAQTGLTGGTLNVFAGNASVGNADGGDLNLSGGAGVGTGSLGKVVFEGSEIQFLNVPVTTNSTIDGVDIGTDVAANTLKVSNANHSGDVTGDTALTIADNVVTLAKMASGTAGALIVYDGTGNPVDIGIGGASDVLTSNASAIPTWEAAGAPGAHDLGGASHTSTGQAEFRIVESDGASGTRWVDKPTGSGTPATTVATSDASAGVVGTDTEYARQDHEHQVVTTGTPGNATPGDSAAAGTSDSLVRLDHQHGLPAFGTTGGTFADGAVAELNTAHRTGSGSDHADVATNTTKVTNANHTGDVTGDTALTIGALKVATGMVQDNAVSLAKMASGTAGALIVFDGSGDPVDIGAGSASNVLTSNGSGIATWEAAGAPGALALGGASQTADTLLNFKTKISDANVTVAGTYIQVADPVASAVDGDIWIETV